MIGFASSGLPLNFRSNRTGPLTDAVGNCSHHLDVPAEKKPGIGPFLWFCCVVFVTG